MAVKADITRDMPDQLEGAETLPRPHLQPLKLTAVIERVITPLTDMA
jgi:hypothetical protein